MDLVKFALPILVLMVLSTSVSAGIGVAKDYLDNGTLILKPGDEYDYRIYLTNTDDDPMNALVSLDVPPPLLVTVSGGLNEVSLPPKTYNKKMTLHIVAPRDIPLETKYKVVIRLKDNSKGDTSHGAVAVAGEISEYFFVQMGDKTVSQYREVAETQTPTDSSTTTTSSSTTTTLSSSPVNEVSRDISNIVNSLNPTTTIPSINLGGQPVNQEGLAISTPMPSRAPLSPWTIGLLFLAILVPLAGVSYVLLSGRKQKTTGVQQRPGYIPPVGQPQQPPLRRPYVPKYNPPTR